MLQHLESYSWVAMNRIPSWADIGGTSFLVIKTVLSVHSAESEMYDEYVLACCN
jgi:hypothetical protein